MTSKRTCVCVCVYIYEHIFMSQKILNNLLLSETFSVNSVSGMLKLVGAYITFYLFTLNFKYGIAAFGTSWY
jgi:hypothetical protein